MTANSIVGQLAGELLAPAGQADPYPLHRRLHEHGPASPICGGAVLVTGYDQAQAALRDPRLATEDAGCLDQTFPAWRDHPSRVLL